MFRRYQSERNFGKFIFLFRLRVMPANSRVPAAFGPRDLRVVDSQCYTGRDDSPDARFIFPTPPVANGSRGAGFGFRTHHLGPCFSRNEKPTSVFPICGRGRVCRAYSNDVLR